VDRQAVHQNFVGVKMDYSRRQLEALGEPIGECVTRVKPGGFGRIYGGGGSPSTPANTTQTTIPDYAKPYMEKVLGKAGALTDSAYQPYKGERIAGSTEEQQAARADVAGMEGPGQFGMGTSMAQQGGIGALGAADRYFSAVTNPNAVQSFMSPYMQNVMDIQKASAIRDAQKAQLGADLGAARQGTYGGARQLLATTERERALGGQLAEIQAKGQQAAYEQALKNMQFGTETGLRGAQTGIQGAQVLGQLGTSQQQAALDLAKAQEAFGSLDQGDKQRQMDMAYQDFLAQQQHPYKQIGFMSDLLRGSANLAGTGSKSVYEAPPSALSQMVGPGLLGLGIYREFMKS
jgi:hypothetical protein